MLETWVERCGCELDGLIVAVAVGGVDVVIAEYYAELSLVDKSSVAVRVKRGCVKQCALYRCIS